MLLFIVFLDKDLKHDIKFEYQKKYTNKIIL